MKLSHYDLMALGRILGYESLDDRGLCYGFSAMLAQAVMAQEEEQFFARLNLIEHYKGKFDVLKIRIDQIKNKVIGRRKITQKEEKLLEIQAFFEGVAIYLHPWQFYDLFGGKRVLQSNIVDIFPLVASRKLENSGGNFSISSRKNYAFNEEELIAYLTDMENCLKNTNSISPIFFNSASHSCFVHYDKTKKGWIYVDTNLLELGEKYYLELNSEELSKFLFLSLCCSSSDIRFPYVVFNSTVVSNNPQSSDRFLLESLHSRHLMTRKHAERYDRQGSGLLYLACDNEDFELVKELLQHSEIDINKALNDGFTPLSIACLKGNVTITKGLLQQPGIDPNKAIATGVTPLILACENGHVDIIKELLQHPDIDINQASKWGTTPFMATQNHAPKEYKAIISLYLNIKQMEGYGKSLLNEDKKKGEGSINLANELRQKVDDFFNPSLLQEGMKAKEFNRFSTQFKKLLHSKDDLMHTHKKLWKPILVNILLALTGIGLLAIAIKSSINIIKSPKQITLQHCLFFSKTNRQKKIEHIEKSLKQMKEEVPFGVVA